MVLHFIGLGLGDETDVTVKGLAVIKRFVNSLYLFWIEKNLFEADPFKV